MRIVISRGAVDLALQELGCMNDELCTAPRLGDATTCNDCREAAERAVKAALGEVFPKAEIVVLR